MEEGGSPRSVQQDAHSLFESKQPKLHILIYGFDTVKLLILSLNEFVYQCFS